jgi:DNA-binding winged helix-turn-helix (wHTH) protein
MRFADFEIDERAGVLRRSGERIRLQDLPFRLLMVLLRRAGDVVTRDELRAELWGSETFVDAEAGLNTAIGKIREALGDSADHPAFIETLPKRGYRFVGALAPENSVPRDLVVETAPERAANTSRRGLYVFAALAVAVIVLAAYSFRASRDHVTIAVVRFHNETGAAANDRLAGTLTDAVVVALAGNPRYGVIGNSPILVTDRIFQDVQKIGAALRAEYVVLGQLQKGDHGLVTRAHFIRVSDQKHLWAGTIDLPDSNTERVLTGAVADGVEIGLERAR